jgi:sugar/nucleoside kinase (ribokinase family)
VHSLYAVENPLMDIIAHVDYAFLKRFGKQPGTMHLVEYAEVEALVREVDSYRMIPGGSAANTARGFAWLAGPAGRPMREEILGHGQQEGLPPALFNGAIGRDERGDEFSRRIEEAGVHASLVRKGTPTGTSVILVTPDGERTMNTFLGACREFGPEDLDLPLIDDSRVLYLTGYLWDTDNQRRAAEAAAARARGARGARKSASGGALVAFDLADPFAVRRYAEQFRAWIPGKVDVIFGNRDEFTLLTGASCDEDCVGAAAGLAPLVVMKVGEKGCLVGSEGSLEPVPGFPVDLVDTTGAGDAFAGGFLYGLLAGADPLTAARLANRLAARVVGKEGCSFD